MALIREIVDGLEILAKTSRRGRDEHLGGAEHDIMFGPESEPTTDDMRKLEELGWHYDEEVGLWSHFC